MRPGPLADILRRFFAQRISFAAVCVLGFILLTAVLADLLASDLPVLTRYKGEIYVLPNIFRPAALRAHDNHSLKRSFGKDDWAVFPLIPFGPHQTQAAGRLVINERPSSTHPLGTDDVGRDVAAQLIHGARVALVVGIVSVLIYVLFGVALGALAGYLGGITDHLVNGAVAVMQTFPAFLLILAIRGFVPSQSLSGVMLVIAVTGWASVARLTRGEVLRILGEPYIESARSAGASHARIVLLHVLPGAVGPVTVAATFGMAWAVLIESALSFLGLGADVPSWGRLLASAQTNLSAWWLTLFPGLALFVCVLMFNFVAEGIQNALDPQRLVSRIPSPLSAAWPKGSGPEAPNVLAGQTQGRIDRI